MKKLWQKFIYLILSPYRFFKALCFGIGFVFILLSLSLAVYGWTLWRSLPSNEALAFEKLKALTLSKVLEKRENKSLKLQWTPISAINRECLFAIVSSEDANYFEHEGIDLESLKKSLALNLLQGRYVAGGSTISQQVAKNLFLSNERSLVRKLKEVLITERLEQHLSKNEILELYLNLAEFGRDLFGVAEASSFYFKTSPAQINAAQGAFMALMLPSPRKHQFIIFENKNLAPAKLKKIRRILGDMLALEYISSQQYKTYISYKFF